MLHRRLRKLERLRTEKDIKDIFIEKNTIHMFTQGLDKDYFVHVHMVMMRLGM